MRSWFYRPLGRLLAGMVFGVLLLLAPRVHAQCIVTFALDPAGGSTLPGGATEFVLNGLARGDCSWIVRPSLDSPPAGITLVPERETATIPAGRIASLRAQVRVAATVAPGRYELSVRLDLLREPADSQPPPPRTLTYTLTVAEVPAGPGQLVTLPGAFDFGEVAVGRAFPAERVLTLRNAGQSDLLVNGLEIRSGLGSPFTIAEALPAFFFLRPGEARDVRVRFDPRAVGAFLDAILIRSSDPENRVALVPVRGRTPGVPDPTQAEVWVDRGCGAFYPIGSRLTLRYWSSRDAAAVLTLRGPDGSERVLLRQIVLAGTTYTFSGTVAAPLGPRRLFLDVTTIDGRTLRSECVYAAGESTPGPF